jgi:hypothetical protein
MRIPGSTATFCGDCVKTCEDVVPNFGENRPGSFTIITAESPRVLDTLTEKDLQVAFQKWRRRLDRCLHAGGNYFEGNATDRLYGEFYDLYSVNPEYFGYIIVF